MSPSVRSADVQKIRNQLQQRVRAKLPNSVFADSVGRTFPIHDAAHVRSLLVTMTAYPTQFKNNPRIKLILKNVLEAVEKFNVKIPLTFRKDYILPEPFVFR